MLFKVFFLLCVIASAMAVELPLNQVLQGSVNGGASVDYEFTYSKTSSPGYQMVYVLPEIGAETPEVSIAKQGVAVNYDVSCSAEASSASGQARCSFSFQGCIQTQAPELYTLTVTHPEASGAAAIDFSVGAINVNSVLTGSTTSLPNLSTCCGFRGASWHYVKAEGQQVVHSVSLTMTRGALSSRSSGLGLLPPGIFIIPDTQVCSDFNILNLATSLDDIVKGLLSFDANFSADSATNTVTVEIDASAQLPGVSYWVLVVSNENSSGEYTLFTDMSGSGAASSLSSPLSAIF